MSKPAFMRKPRPLCPKYLSHGERAGMRQDRGQLILPFADWEEVREPRAFGPPGKRAYR